MKGESVLLGIDLGTTVLKGAAFDAKTGQALDRASERLPVLATGNGRREQKMVDIDGALKKVCSRLRRKLGKRWWDVAGIGLSSQAGSTIIVDRETGRAHTTMILWNDSRAFEYLPRISVKKNVRYWRSFSLQDQPAAGLGRILWFRDHRPELLSGENMAVGAGEYVYHRLTGEWRQDAGNALQIGCYSVPKGDLIPGPLELVGVPLDFFAPMRRGHETNPLSKEGAKFLGLSEGIPVAGPYFDHEAGYLSAVAASKRPLQCSLGTAWVGNFVLPEGVKGGSPFQLVCPSPAGEGRLVVQPLMTGNVTWDWGLENLAGGSQKRALAKTEQIFKESLMPRQGLIALPWFARPNTFSGSAFGAGAFFGMDPGTDRDEMLRALALGMTCELARIFEQVRTSGCVDSLILGGGASKGFYFRQLIAALFYPLSVYVLEDEDLAGARGSVYAFSRKVAGGKKRKVRRPGKKVRECVRTGYHAYLEVFERLYGGVKEGGRFRVTN
jgi:sugar (pentulose or hexulose) kinase